MKDVNAACEAALKFLKRAKEDMRMDPSAASSMRRNHMQFKLRIAADDIMGPYAEMALNGDADADAVLRGLLVKLVSEGKPFPQPLRQYAEAVIRQKLPPKKRGRHLYSNRGRDMHVALAVKMVHRKHGFAPFRKPTSKVASACSIVASALSKMKMAIDERSVEKIWERYDWIR